MLTKKLNTVTCRGAAVTLVPPFSGDLQLVLRMPDSSPSLRYCASFGGDTRRNDATSQGSALGAIAAPQRIPDEEEE
ncbi:MAG: hypothetical protein ACRERC_21065 [Candidatus Binatia bacterium]